MSHEIKPVFIPGERIGMCSESHCPSYDGKRCRILGYRAQRLCEPWINLRLAELEALEQTFPDNQEN